MPEYPFRTPAGDVIHRVYAMKDAPSIGTTVEIDGQQCVRLASDFQANGNPHSGRFPTIYPGLPPIPECKQDHRGFNIIRDKKHKAEICKKYGLIDAGA